MKDGFGNNIQDSEHGADTTKLAKTYLLRDFIKKKNSRRMSIEFACTLIPVLPCSALPQTALPGAALFAVRVC